MMRAWILCASIAYASVAVADPRAGARERYERAVKLDESGEYDKALEMVEQGLAIAPKDLKLLGLKGSLLLRLRDYTGALAAYQAYLGAGATGANQREVQKIVESLRAVKTTFLEISVANGPAEVYLDSKTQGVLCRVETTCNKPMLPGEYGVIAERPGFDRWTGRVTVEQGKTAKLAITLAESRSLLTVRARPAGARVTVDGAAYGGPVQIAAGTHRVAVALEGHVEEQREVEAREGKPLELEIALERLIPVRVAPPGAEVLLDGKPLELEGGAIRLGPGAHTLVARAPGFRERRVEIPAERAADYQIAVELARIEASVGRPSSFTFRRKLAVASGGVGVVALTGGVLLGLGANDLDEQTLELCPSEPIPCPRAEEANELNRRARTRALQANISYGVAAGAAITAAVLWITGAPESRVSVAPRLGAVTGLDLEVRF